MPPTCPSHACAHVSPLPCPQKVDPTGKPTVSAHPGKLVVPLWSPGMSGGVALTCPRTPAFCFAAARFSPDDKFSRHRVTTKKRFGLYLPTLPEKAL